LKVKHRLNKSINNQYINKAARFLNERAVLTE